MSRAFAVRPSEEARNERISQALERYKRLIWKNCNRFGQRWAEDAYQQMVTKALARDDLMEKSVDELGRKLSFMALTESAHMARSQRRRDAAIDTIKASSPKYDSFEEPLVSLDALLDTISRIPDEKALVFSLSKQGYGESEIESIAGLSQDKVKRVVRDVNAAIGDVIMHLDAGICEEQAQLLTDYASDASIGHGKEKKLDRRVRSRLKNHLEICDVCTAYVEKARGEVGTVLVAALPAQVLFNQGVGTGKFSGAVQSLADLIAGSSEKLKLALHGLSGKAEPVSQAATGAGASGIGPGRIAAACGTAVACVVFGAVQGVPDVKHILTKTKTAQLGMPGNSGQAPASKPKPYSTVQPTESYVQPGSSAGGPEENEKAQKEQQESEPSKAAPPPGQEAGAAATKPQAKPPEESDGGPEFSPDKLGAELEPGG